MTALPRILSSRWRPRLMQGCGADFEVPLVLIVIDTIISAAGYEKIGEEMMPQQASAS